MPVNHRRRQRPVLLAIVLVAGGLAAGAVGLIAAGHYVDDLCTRDLAGHEGYAAYRSETGLWPPEFTCHLTGPDTDPLVVKHRFVALARTGAVLVVPLVVVFLAAALLMRPPGRAPERTPRNG